MNPQHTLTPDSDYCFGWFQGHIKRGQLRDFYPGMAKHIVHCVNCHDQLLAALDYLLAQTVDMDLEYGIGLPEGEADARAKALAAIAQAWAGTAGTELDIHQLLAGRRQIALGWSVEDVQEVRPDLTDEQAWEVLQQVERQHDASLGVTWDTLEWSAEDLFGPAPETDEA